MGEREGRGGKFFDPRNGGLVDAKIEDVGIAKEVVVWNTYTGVYRI